MPIRGWMAGSLAVLGLVVLGGKPAMAETHKMVCKNSRYTYTISYDDETKRFQWASDGGQVEYYVVRVKIDEDGLTVWGKARRYGNDFIAYFSTEGWMKSFYANGSSMTDVCLGPH